jgi:hypothetical protein
MNTDIVIARYSEDINWALQLEKTDNISIYNKGDLFDFSPIEIRWNNLSYEELPNIGREGHSYIYHIVENYNWLSEYTAFLQGNPFDHIDMPQLQERLQIEEEWTWLTRWNPSDDIRGGRYHGGILSIGTYFEKYFKKPAIQEYVFGAGCQFKVRRDRILTRPKSFYEEILRDFERDELFPWTFERLAFYIFYEDIVK